MEKEKKDNNKGKKRLRKRNCYLVFFISHNKWLRKDGIKKTEGKK